MRPSAKVRLFALTLTPPELPCLRGILRQGGEPRIALVHGVLPVAQRKPDALPDASQFAPRQFGTLSQLPSLRMNEFLRGLGGELADFLELSACCSRSRSPSSKAPPADPFPALGTLRGRPLARLFHARECPRPRCYEGHAFSRDRQSARSFPPPSARAAHGRFLHSPSFWSVSASSVHFCRMVLVLSLDFFQTLTFGDQLAARVGQIFSHAPPARRGCVPDCSPPVRLAVAASAAAWVHLRMVLAQGPARAPPDRLPDVRASRMPLDQGLQRNFQVPHDGHPPPDAPRGFPLQLSSKTRNSAMLRLQTGAFTIEDLQLLFRRPDLVLARFRQNVQVLRTCFPSREVSALSSFSRESSASDCCMRLWIWAAVFSR